MEKGKEEEEERKKDEEKDNVLCIICRHSDGPFCLRSHNDMTCGSVQSSKHLLPQFTLRLSVKL